VTGSEPAGHQSSTTEGLIAVRLLGLSLPTWQRTREHADELRREFAIMRISGHQGVPLRLLSLMAELDDRYRSFANEMNSDVQTAIERGDSQVDLVFELPGHALADVQRLGELFDEADDYCREGNNLLTLASSPETIAFRRWYLGQIVAQLSGEQPTPWVETTAPAPANLSGRWLAEATATADLEPAVEPDQLNATISPGPGPGEVLLTLAGEIDLAVTDDLRGRFLEVHARAEAVVVVDLAGVGFMDSTGLSVLISAWKRLKGEGRSLIVQNPRTPVRQLLETCGLSDLLEVRQI
jgi:anti-anti-sigma factor